MAVNIGLNLFRHELTPAEVVKKSREDRFFAREIIDGIFTDFIEFRSESTRLTPVT